MRLRLSRRVLLRKFDCFYAYNAETDELYELDDEAFNFLMNLDDSSGVDSELLEYLISEGLVVDDVDSEGSIDVAFAEEPSLRYLLLNVTWDCNLRCEHCYVVKRGEFMDVELFKSAVDQFASIGGLKLMISGGEPMLHPHIWKMLSYARRYPQRIMLLTNGYLLTDKSVERLAELVDEVQISIDGLEGHEKLRGVSCEPLLRKVEMLVEVGLDVSVSTMVTKYNVDEMGALEKVLIDLNVKRWTLDVPTTSNDVLPPLSVAAEILTSFGFGDASYDSSGDYACGAHLAAVTPSGDVTKCGFFDDAVGNVREGLYACWERLKERYIWKVEDLECKCEFLRECRGGCRYRALQFTGSLMGCDAVMCLSFGIQPPCGTHLRP